MASATDNFNRANETPLAAPWVRQTGGSGTINLAGNAVQAAGAGDKFYYYTGAAATADQYSEARQVSLVLNNDWGPACRIGGASLNGYWAGAANVGGGPGIEKDVAGVYTRVKAVGTTTVAGDVIRLEVQGSTLRWIKNGVTLDTATDVSLSSGQPGLFIYDTGGAIDDWAGGDLGVGTTPSFSETGTGTETTALVAAITATQTGAGVDTPTLAALLPSQADTGAGADTGSLAAAIPAPDTSGGIDAAALAAALSAADAALGNDSFSVLAPGAPTFSDLGAGTDAFSVSVQLSTAEAGTATETTTLQFSATLANTGIGADAISATAALSASEAGVGSDTILPPTAFISIGEAPLATDTGAIASVSYILGEAGVGVDAFSRAQGLFLGTATGQGRIDPKYPRGRIESSLAGRIERPSRGSIERRTS